MPLGNVTSQIFANIYLNPFDWFVKQELHERYYFRYVDDFIILDPDALHLKEILSRIRDFLQIELYLKLHPEKITIRKFRQGIDFLGYVVLPHHRQVRAKTRQRVFRKVRQNLEDYSKGLVDADSLEQSLQSYLGILKHCNGYKMRQLLINEVNSYLNKKISMFE